MKKKVKKPKIHGKTERRYNNLYDSCSGTATNPCDLLIKQLVGTLLEKILGSFSEDDDKS